MRVLSKVSPVRHPPKQTRFSGVYALEGGEYGPPLEKLNEITDEIKLKAAQANMPLLTEDESVFEGMGNSSLVRYFLTEQNATDRTAQRARKEAAKKLFESAMTAVNTAVQNALDGVIVKALADKVKAGIFTQQEADDLKARISLNYQIQGVEEPLPSLKKQAKPYHRLTHQFVMRYINHTQERAHMIKAIRNGQFDIRTGALSPDTPFERPGPDSLPPYEWYKEG